jgi:hypothetical protein
MAQSPLTDAEVTAFDAFGNALQREIEANRVPADIRYALWKAIVDLPELTALRRASREAGTQQGPAQARRRPHLRQRQMRNHVSDGQRPSYSAA